MESSAEQTEVSFLPSQTTVVSPRRIPVKWRSKPIVFALILVAYPLLHWMSGNAQPPWGWQNASIPGNSWLLTSNLVLSIAVSPDVPGLILACIYSDDFPMRNPHMMTWRSRDFGQHWEVVNNPFDSILTEYFAPNGGNGSFFADELANAHSDTHTLWVTHDEGTTWEQITKIGTLNDWQVLHALAGSYYRNGQLYALYPWTTAHNTILEMSVSANDGKTWHKTTITPSLLERRGWQAQSITPDYRDAHAWFRVMTQGTKVVTQPPVLEHSNDDGQHWQQLSVMGSLTAGTITLATSASQPAHLCATNSLYSYWFTDNPNPDNNGPLSLLTSSDAGMTWGIQLVPPNPPAESDGKQAVGNVRTNVVMGADGSCYQARYFTWQLPHDGMRFTRDETTIYRLNADGAHLTTSAFLPGYAPNGGPESFVFDYIPMPSHHGRLVMSMLNLQPDAWHFGWMFVGIMTGNIPSLKPLYWLPVT